MISAPVRREKHCRCEMAGLGVWLSRLYATMARLAREESDILTTTGRADKGLQQRLGSSERRDHQE